MKNRIFIIIIAISSMIVSSCAFEEDDVNVNKKAPVGDIQFVVDQTALLSTAAAVVQPSYDVTAARFARAGNTKVTVKVSSDELTKLAVNYLSSNTSGVIRQNKSNLDISSGTAEWSYPMSTLGLNGAPVTTGTVVIEFVATSADGTSSVTRVFSVTGI